MNAGEQVQASALAVGDLVRRHGQTWIVQGPDPGGLVALTEPDDAAEPARVALLSPIDWVERVQAAPERLVGVPYLWASEPMEDMPLGHAGTAYLRAELDAALAGVQLGAYDQRILDWLATWDLSTVATVVSLIVRARDAGPHPSAHRSCSRRGGPCQCSCHTAEASGEGVPS